MNKSILLSDLTSKTPEELNVMCAELCGWIDLGEDAEQTQWWIPKRINDVLNDIGWEAWAKHRRTTHGLPNYTGSWDAIMPEVRKLDGDDLKEKFSQAVVNQLDDPNSVPEWDFLRMTPSPLQLTQALILTLHP